jgi:hypothetical protein
VCPKDSKKAHTGEYGNDWKRCTQCTCKATNKKGFFTLNNFDSEHEENLQAKKAQANLTRVEEDPSAVIPLGPPVLVTLPQYDSDDEDQDQMTFTGAWFTPVVPDEDGEDDV